MKVEDRVLMPLREVEPGDCFRYAGKLCIKAYTPNNLTQIVNLDTGSVYSCGEMIPVEKVNAKVVVE